jgi:hypothetical protein
MRTYDVNFYNRQSKLINFIQKSILEKKNANENKD